MIPTLLKWWPRPRMHGDFTIGDLKCPFHLVTRFDTHWIWWCVKIDVCTFRLYINWSWSLYTAVERQIGLDCSSWGLDKRVALKIGGALSVSAQTRQLAAYWEQLIVTTSHTFHTVHAFQQGRALGFGAASTVAARSSVTTLESEECGAKESAWCPRFMALVWWSNGPMIRRKRWISGWVLERGQCWISRKDCAEVYHIIIYNCTYYLGTFWLLYKMGECVLLFDFSEVLACSIRQAVLGSSWFIHSGDHGGWAKELDNSTLSCFTVSWFCAVLGKQNAWFPHDAKCLRPIRQTELRIILDTTKQAK